MATVPPVVVTMSVFAMGFAVFRLCIPVPVPFPVAVFAPIP